MNGYCEYSFQENKTCYAGDWYTEMSETGRQANVVQSTAEDRNTLGTRIKSGLVIYANGATLDGKFNGGKSPNGWCCFTSQQGHLNFGDSVQGRVRDEGFYKLYYQKTNNFYEGQFYQGERNGIGIYSWADNKRYFGDIVVNKITGKGRLTYQNGDRYVGDFESGLRHGRGTMNYVDDGRTYTGNWLRNKKHGHGKTTFLNGDSFEGNHSGGKRDRLGTQYYADGSRYEGKWKGMQMVEEVEFTDVD